MDRSEDGSNDQRGLVVKRDLDAERQGRPAERSKDSDEEQERSSGRRFRFNWNSDDQSTDDSTGQSSRSHAVDLPGDSGNMTVQSPLLGTATFASRPMIRPLGQGPACTCVTCASQRAEKLTEILADDSSPALHRILRLDDVVEQAMRPFMWTLLGITIMLFILPVISGPIHVRIDSVHHTLSRISLEKTATSPVNDLPLTFELSILASTAESVARAYIDSLNAYDNDGIVTHVTDQFRQSAIDRAFIANNLGTQMRIEKLIAGNLCDDVGCHVDVTARTSGSQMANAGGH